MSKYYNMDKINKIDARFNLIFGERSNREKLPGKT